MYDVDILIIIMAVATGKAYQYIFYKYVDPVYHLTDKYRASAKFRLWTFIVTIVANLIIITLVVILYKRNIVVSVILLMILFCIIITDKILWDENRK